jgi:hypothetical protein
MPKYYQTDGMRSNVNEVLVEQQRRDVRQTHPAPVEKLEHLKRLKSRLTAYLDSLISSRELSELCTPLRKDIADVLVQDDKLVKENREQDGKLYSEDFWKMVDGNLAQMYDKTLGLDSLIREDEDLKDSVEHFKCLKDAFESVRAREASPGGVSYRQLAESTQRAARNLDMSAMSITKKCRTRAYHILEVMGDTIRDIRIWLVTDKEAREPSEHLVGIETKLKEGLRQDAQISQRVTVGEAASPSEATRANAPRYRPKGPRKESESNG